MFKSGTRKSSAFFCSFVTIQLKKKFKKKWYLFSNNAVAVFGIEIRVEIEIGIGREAM